MKVLVTGGAGFIGSNLVDRLMSSGHHVTVVDNFSGGRNDFLREHYSSPRFRLSELDVRDTAALTKEIDADTEMVFHLAANADIARGVEDPSLDFEHSLVATFSVLRAMRHHGVRRIFYTSGSGVYGDLGLAYSAEGLVSAFVHLFDMQAWILRPANIIGPRSTHGVVFDFVRRLKKDPTELRILGDGKQSKAYLHVEDVIDAMMLVLKKARAKISIFNVSSNSFITVNEIARVVIASMRLRAVKLKRTGGKVGWKGDVPIVRLRNTELKKLGWRAKYDSAKAVRATVAALLLDPRFTAEVSS
jgi:UDP-glucose 4-epimerase